MITQLISILDEADRILDHFEQYKLVLKNVQQDLEEINNLIEKRQQVDLKN